MMTCDDTWMHHCDLLTKWEYEYWKRKDEPWGKKGLAVEVSGEGMLIMFFGHRGHLLSALCTVKDDDQQRISPQSLEDPPVAC